jgi:tRNA pseudouridine 55 synthase
MSRRRPRWNGLLPVAKASGPTSHDVVDMARRALGERRIGHTGTLDPAAEGLLLLCVGRTTRLQQYLLGWNKTYRGLLRLGRATTTYDAEGETIPPSGPVPELDDTVLASLAQRFSGEIQQLPPPYSAKKVAGRKLYELAREGRDVEVKPKAVTVLALKLERAAGDLLSFEVTTSTGFYVRSLAHDIGVHLGCGGHLKHLERVNIGPYTLDRALPQAELEATEDPATIVEGPFWIPLDAVELPFPRIDLNPAARDRFLHGGEVIVLHRGPTALAPGDSVAVHGQEGPLIGVGVAANVLARGRTVVIRPRMVLAEDAS